MIFCQYDESRLLSLGTRTTKHFSDCRDGFQATSDQQLILNVNCIILSSKNPLIFFLWWDEEEAKNVSIQELFGKSTLTDISLFICLQKSKMPLPISILVSRYFLNHLTYICHKVKILKENIYLFPFIKETKKIIS